MLWHSLPKLTSVWNNTNVCWALLEKRDLVFLLSRVLIVLYLRPHYPNCVQLCTWHCVPSTLPLLRHFSSSPWYWLLLPFMATCFRLVPKFYQGGHRCLGACFSLVVGGVHPGGFRFCPCPRCLADLWVACRSVVVHMCAVVAFCGLTLSWSAGRLIISMGWCWTINPSERSVVKEMRCGWTLTHGPGVDFPPPSPPANGGVWHWTINPSERSVVKEMRCGWTLNV